MLIPPIKSEKIPDGRYNAKVTSNYLTILGYENDVIILPYGIRGINVKCMVTIKDGIVKLKF